jgi:hypothetical protein
MAVVHWSPPNPLNVRATLAIEPRLGLGPSLKHFSVRVPDASGALLQRTHSGGHRGKKPASVTSL